MRMMNQMLGAVIAVQLLLAPAADAGSHAEEQVADASADEDQVTSGWEFNVAPYVWLPGAQGSVTIDGTTVPIDSTVGDTFDLLGSLEAGGAMAHIGVRQDKLGFFVDFQFLAIGTTNAVGPRGLGSVRSKILEYFLEYGASYRVLEHATSIGPNAPISVDLIAGGRWNRITTQLAFSKLDHDLKSKVEFMDPLVGGRFVVPFYGSDDAGDFSIRFRGDIGGFGAGSDLSWSALGALQWHMPWTMGDADMTMIAGYKTYYFRVSQVSDGVDSQLALQSGGPALGLALSF